ncbi:MAG: adenosylhomocysteinase, partial [Erysipelotrichaceae bacterium]|nr:adenosylhomocysteinase [Erysipelotrichaceae bacterium]
MKSDIRDITLAPYGHTKIEWVRNNMPLLRGMEEEFAHAKPFEGVRISLSIHLEPKTAYLCKVLAAGGAEMSITGSNSLSTQDDVCAALVDDGLKVFAYHGATEEEYARHIEMCLEHKPNIIIDDGGDLVGLVHDKRPDLAECCWGGCEETTT